MSDRAKAVFPASVDGYPGLMCLALWIGFIKHGDVEENATILARLLEELACFLAGQ